VWPAESLRVEDIVDLRELQWRRRAACQGTDPDMWFAAESTTERAVLERICSTCPVFTECLDHAIAYDEKGFWAGTTRIDRHEIVAEETGQAPKYHRYEPKH
jgi:hypothetical protein